MAEMIIQNPSITTNVFEYDEVGRVSAISGHPLAGGGGGTIVKSDLMWKPNVGDDGFVHWTLESSATTPDEAYISGAQGPAGENGTNGYSIELQSVTDVEGGKQVTLAWGETPSTSSFIIPSGTNGKDGEDGISLSATSTELDQQRKTQVQIGQVNGPVQTTFELPWGQNGVSPTVTVTNIPADPSDPNHKKGGTEITITDAITTNKFSAWNGNDGTMAGAPDIEGKNGISAVLDGSTYEVGLSSEFYKAVTSVSSKLDESDFTTYTATTAPGTFQPIGNYLTTVATSGSIIGTGLATNKIGLVTSAEQALAAVDGKVSKPGVDYSFDYAIWDNQDKEWVNPFYYLTPALDNDIPQPVTSKQYVMGGNLIWQELTLPSVPDITANNGLSANGHTIGIDNTNLVADTQYAWTTTGWDEVSTPTIPAITAESGISADGYKIGLTTTAINAITSVSSKVDKPSSLIDKYLVLRTDNAGNVSGWCDFQDQSYSKSEALGTFVATANIDTTTLSGDGKSVSTKLGVKTDVIPTKDWLDDNYLPLSGGTVSGSTYFSAASGQNLIAVASAASLIGASRQSEANFGQNNNAMGTTWMGVGGPGMYRGFFKYTQGGDVGALDSQNMMQIEFTPSNKGQIFAKATNNGTAQPETQIINATTASVNNMQTSGIDSNNVSGPNYMIAKNADGQFVIGAAVFNCQGSLPGTLQPNTYYFVY